MPQTARWTNEKPSRKASATTSPPPASSNRPSRASRHKTASPRTRFRRRRRHGRYRQRTRGGAARVVPRPPLRGRRYAGSASGAHRPARRRRGRAAERRRLSTRNLHDYYLRASYGALTVTGEAFDYAAQHERDFYTANIGQLYKEALDHLEASGIDLARFDANGDGRIDAVYLHFAGGDTGWGSVWWSNERVLDVPDAVYADGTVRLWNAVALSNPCDQPWAAQTIIHETGHVLGLPDYYQYASQQGGSADRTGILTFDIMMQNQGDHNGFSKWMLGWLPDSKITRIFANETGIDVKRDGKVVQHVDATADGSSSVEAALEAFASNDIDETGGIVVVANQDASMFSSYYLLQYDRFAGNQSVRYEQDGQPAELPSGFRLFRVQADLGSGGPYSFIRTRTEPCTTS